MKNAKINKSSADKLAHSFSVVFFRGSGGGSGDARLSFPCSPSAARGAGTNGDSFCSRHRLREPLPSLQSFSAGRIPCYLYPDAATFTNHLICRCLQNTAASRRCRAPGLLRIKDSSVNGPSLIESGFVAAGRGRCTAAATHLCISPRLQHALRGRFVSPHAAICPLPLLCLCARA